MNANAPKASVLGIDTSAAACSAAIWRGGAVAATESVPMARGHAEALMPMIERTMRAAGLAYSDLAAVAATRGPGAFTGLRIGLAAARGLALAAGIPAIGISAFRAIAAGIPARARAGRTLAVAIDTKRGDVYLQCFAAGLESVAEARVVRPEEATAALPAGPLYIAGDGVPLLRAALAARATEIAFDPRPAPPDAGRVAELGAAALARGVPLPPPEPLYLRAPEATPLALQGRKR